MTTPNPPRPELSDAELRRAALIAARLGGCSCDPVIVIRHEGGIAHAEVRHDDGCAYIFMRPTAGEA